MNKSGVIFLLVMFLACNMGFAVTVSVDFDQSTDLNDTDWNYQGVLLADSGYSWDAGNGTGGTGGVNVTGSGSVTGYTAVPFDGTLAGAIFTISLDVKINTSLGSGSKNQLARVGLLSGPGVDFGGSAVGSRVTYNPGTGEFRWDNPQDTGGEITGIVDGNWHRLEAVCEARDDLGTGSEQGYFITSTLYDLGADGLAAPTVVQTVSGEKITALRTDTEILAGFKAREMNAADTLDNFWATDSGITPTPADNSTLVPLDTQLAWSDVDGTPTSQRLYLREGDPNFAAGGNMVNGDEVVSPYTIGSTLTTSITYFWRVDIDVDGDTLQGGPWSFTTIPEVPVITKQPENLLLWQDEIATFEIIASGTASFSYEWKKDDGDGLPNSGDQPVGTAGATLTFDPASGNEGVYYCVLVHASGEVYSEMASLVIKKEVCHWMFDGDLTDATGNGYDGAALDPNTFDEIPAPVPVYGTGIDGQALDADQICIQHVLPAEETWMEYSVSVWCKANVIPQENYAGVFNNNSEGLVDFQLSCGSDVYRYRGSSAVTMGPISTSDWVMLTATFDGENTRLYYNGKFVDENTEKKNVFGRLAVGCNRGDTVFFNGLIDDMRVFNYARTAEDIATDYYTFTNQGVCLYPPALDLTDDCLVDLADFAEFAAVWLECGLIPVEACN